MPHTQPARLDAAHFDSKARQWDDNPLFQQRGLKIADAIRKAVALHRHMSALDYGCGMGLLSFPLKDELGAILLADSSVGMLDVVNEKIAAQGATNMTTMKLDLLADPPPAQRFDLIVTSMTLHHMPDTDHILRIFHDLLKPGGALCIADLDQEDGSLSRSGGRRAPWLRPRRSGAASRTAWVLRPAVPDCVQHCQEARIRDA